MTSALLVVLTFFGIVFLVLLLAFHNFVRALVRLFFAYWIDKAHGRNTFS